MARAQGTMLKRRRTKIVATLGPASSDAATVARLIEAGVNVFRLNFSHGTHEQHRRHFEIVRGVARDRVISIVDPQARHGHKSQARRFDGYKTHIAIDPEDEIITEALATPANTPDRDVVDELVDVLGVSEDSIKTKLSQSWGRDDTFVPIRTLAGAALSAARPKLAVIEGVQVQPTRMRSYPSGLASQTLGYLTEASEADAQKRAARGVQAGDLIGKADSGLEATLDDILGGTYGWKLTIIEPNLITLPELPANEAYQYDPGTEQLMVVPVGPPK